MDYRADRMRSLIIRTFYNCLENMDFSELTVGQIAAAAQINRSTFYRYFEDKYQLRDQVTDQIVSDFVSNLEVEFLDVDIAKDRSYLSVLQHSLERTYLQKRELEILWSQKLLGRNIFEEMIMGGARKMEEAIRQNERIAPEKKQYADWYARLLVNNMLVTIRWWFSNRHMVDARQVSEMMIRHMTSGTIPTLKGAE